MLGTPQVLKTGPNETQTHWKQTVFYLKEGPLPMAPGEIVGSLPALVPAPGCSACSASSCPWCCPRVLPPVPCTCTLWEQPCGNSDGNSDGNSPVGTAMGTVMGTALWEQQCRFRRCTAHDMAAAPPYPLSSSHRTVPQVKGRLSCLPNPKNHRDLDIMIDYRFQVRTAPPL